MNGYTCKDPSKVTVDDFFLDGAFAKPANISSVMGSGVTIASVGQMPGLYTQNILMGRADYVPNGFNPPHLHHRATEFVVVLEGTLLVGFVSSYPNFVNYNKTLQKGDAFVVPQGLIHYLYNTGKENAVALFAFNSYEAGIIPITYNIFGSKPELDATYLAKAFQLDEKIIRELQSKF